MLPLGNYHLLDGKMGMDIAGNDKRGAESVGKLFPSTVQLCPTLLYLQTCMTLHYQNQNPLLVCYLGVNAVEAK